MQRDSLARSLHCQDGFSSQRDALKHQQVKPSHLATLTAGDKPITGAILIELITIYYRL